MQTQNQTLDYSTLSDGSVAVSNHSGVLGHVRTDDTFDDDLRDWCDRFPADVCESFVTSIAAAAVRARSIPGPEFVPCQPIVVEPGPGPRVELVSR